MKREINLAWCREKLKPFADMERVKEANARELRELAAKYAGCPKVPQDRRAA